MTGSIRFRDQHSHERFDGILAFLSNGHAGSWSLKESIFLWLVLPQSIPLEFFLRRKFRTGTTRTPSCTLSHHTIQNMYNMLYVQRENRSTIRLLQVQPDLAQCLLSAAHQMDSTDCPITPNRNRAGRHDVM